MWPKLLGYGENIKPSCQALKHFHFCRVCLPQINPMKKSAIIASHIAVFALGASVAVITTRNSDADPRDQALEESGRATPDRLSRPGAAGASGREISRSKRDSSNGLQAASGKVSPRELLGKINKISNSYERQRALMDFYENLAPDQFADVADEFQKLYHYDNSDGEMELLFCAWAKTDPTTALSYIDENPDMRRNRNEVLETWAANDAAAAEKWAIEKHEGDGPNPYLASVIKGIAAYDLTNAKRLTESMPHSRERGQAIDAMAKALLISGTENAFAFTDTITDETLKGSFIMMISQNLSQQDPQAAADWVASMDNGALQSRASASIADRLARVDVKKAAEFVESLRPEAKATAAAATVPAMSANDIAGTARWVTSLAGTPGYDRVVESFVWSCDERAPEQSAAWIRGISDEAQQSRLYYRMLGNWAKKDAAAVRSWVAENNVPEPIKKRFIR
jgi:hypothetical protein